MKSHAMIGGRVGKRSRACGEGRVNKVFATLLATLAAAVFLAPAVGHAALGDCGQPLTEGAKPTASDCLFILQAAVGSHACSPKPCICNTGGTGGITASDSLLCLRKAVGQDVQLMCSCTVTTTSSSTVSTSTSSTITLPPTTLPPSAFEGTGAADSAPAAREAGTALQTLAQPGLQAAAADSFVEVSAGDVDVCSAK